MADEQEGKLQLLVMLPASLKRAFEEQCRADGRSMTDVIMELVSGYVAE